MFLLDGLLGPLLLTAAISAVTVLLGVVILYAILRSQGRILIRAKKTRLKTGDKHTPKTPVVEDTLPEEELVAILSATVCACGETEKKRFRVVSFRRM